MVGANLPGGLGTLCVMSGKLSGGDCEWSLMQIKRFGRRNIGLISALMSVETGQIIYMRKLGRLRYKAISVCVYRI